MPKKTEDMVLKYMDLSIARMRRARDIPESGRRRVRAAKADIREIIDGRKLMGLPIQCPELARAKIRAEEIWRDEVFAKMRRDDIRDPMTLA